MPRKASAPDWDFSQRKRSLQRNWGQVLNLEFSRARAKLKAWGQVFDLWKQEAINEGIRHNEMHERYSSTVCN